MVNFRGDSVLGLNVDLDTDPLMRDMFDLFQNETNFKRSVKIAQFGIVHEIAIPAVKRKLKKLGGKNFNRTVPGDDFHPEPSFNIYRRIADALYVDMEEDEADVFKIIAGADPELSQGSRGANLAGLILGGSPPFAYSANTPNIIRSSVKHYSKTKDISAINGLAGKTHPGFKKYDFIEHIANITDKELMGHTLDVMKEIFKKNGFLDTLPHTVYG
jgi:hypothetical protein